MRATPVETTITIFGDDDEEIEVTFLFTPGQKASTDEFGRKETPDDEDDFQFLDAVDERGNTRILSPREESAALDTAHESVLEENHYEF